MRENDDFDLKDFTPYLLAMAAETAGAKFQKLYKDRYGMLRTEWRVLFHIGQYGNMTAREICDRARLHKTKVSRAVSALEAKRFLSRQRQENDRRHEILSLTKLGQSAFNDLFDQAQRFDDRLMSAFSEDERQLLRRCLARIAQL